ncbi:hypothetical protein FRACYDRAFT_246405 [Fragilariopsis cylindrus CCMP1102]|uniref:Uncharacterized protein n=1 Tax=Fragilariopsis cylindrus CCMP1102 TaxID=635003 RepID=A0A1E7EZD3_9STRA|nr:hypothetical protein FRACYDRAFT_246405 [Fragilariopsis cylindrus CCMP1102]|eukprot:OEU11291.1 hypothetical protein FRACYDRAFT_246405 [Fragilariopsis cylindrus CCMP1102]
MMIYKEEGNVHIHRLRVIHLYEADLGFLWGAKWGQAMKRAVKDKSLHQGQYGGLPGRDCTSLTYLEELRFDYSLMTRFSFANFDNDATACYDRILCCIASLAGRKYGIHKDVIFVHAKTLEEAEFKLKTSTKISDTSYRHCIKFPIHGTGQGSTNSPMIWCFISSVLFQCHNQRAHGMLFESPSKDMIVRFNMVGFVDDSTCITGGNKNDTLQDLIRKMKEDAQLWHDLLWCSGGKLELPKCGYHVIHFEYENSGIPTMIVSPGDSILLQNEHGNDVKIESKNIFQPRTNLGHIKGPMQRGITQTETVAEKGTRLTNSIVKCGCSRTETRLLYDTVWKPAIEYVIPQSFLSDKQLSKIEKACMPQIYAKCGFNRNTSRALLAGPVSLGGGGFTPLKVTAGAGYVTHFLKNWRTQTEDIGKHLRICYTWAILQAGVTFPLFEQPAIELPHLKGKVIPATRKYLAAIDGKIHLDNTMIRQPIRVHDQCIMDTAIDIREELNLTDIQLERINCVRMYLGVMFLSEISTIAGTALQPGITTGNNNELTYNTSLTKPNQKKPNNQSWALWTKVISRYTSNGSTLNQPLGQWTQAHHTSGRWESYVSNIDTNTVYRHQQVLEENHQYWEVYRVRGTQLTLEDNIDISEFNTRDGSPIQLHTLSNGSTHTTRTSTVIPAPPITTPRYGPMVNWDDFLLSQHQWIQELLSDVRFFTDDGYPDFYQILAEHDRHGHLICVSDGSVIFHDMSFGWVLASTSSKRLVDAKGPCRGRGNSLRSEGVGMLSATMLVSIISQYLNTELNVLFISDNDELIKRCNAHKHYNDPFPNETLRSEYDVTEQIFSTINDSQIKAKYKWVKGHQDSAKAYDDLSLEAQLNVDADALAGEYQEGKRQFHPMVNILPSCPAMLSIRGISVTSNYKKQLIRAYVEPEYIAYLQYKFGWSDSIINTIAWKCLQLAIQRINRDVVLAKICNDLLPTAAALCKRSYQNHDGCLLCHQIETQEHILRCKSNTRLQGRRKFITKLRNRLAYLGTQFAISETLCSSINEWLETGEVDYYDYPKRFHKAIKTQDSIGWRHIFAGKLSQQWIILHDASPVVEGIAKREGYVWGASITEITMTHFIQSWELRNEEVHGKTEEQQEKTRKARLMIEVRRLNSMRSEARPSDECLFIDNEETYYDQSSATTIATFISNHRRAILNSVKKWAKASQTGITSILHWVSGCNSAETIARIHSVQRDNLINDGRQKKKKRRKQTKGRQTSIAGYFTLNNVTE